MGYVVCRTFTAKKAALQNIMQRPNNQSETRCLVM